jgi:hypothetical protein
MADQIRWTTGVRRCDWPDCPGYPKDVEMHEIESGPELHPQCKDRIIAEVEAGRA